MGARGVRAPTRRLRRQVAHGRGTGRPVSRPSACGTDAGPGSLALVPHIHTSPGQHDLTCSAYIVRTDLGAPRVLVHRHRKLGRLMQIGGHVELAETPWSALAHEVVEESGYDLDQLAVLQVVPLDIEAHGAVRHPTPFQVNTHRLPGDHLHTDLGYAFVTDQAPRHATGEGESRELSWPTPEELRAEVGPGGALADVAEFYTAVVEQLLPVAVALPADSFSLEDPERLSD